MEAKILVIGGGGKLGQEVLSALTARRIPARTVSPAVQAASEGREIVRFDYAEPETFERAFGGIERVFLSGFPPARDMARLVFPAVDAAIRCGVKYFILHSRLGVERLPKSAENLLERYLARTKIAVTFLRCGLTMQSMLTMHEYSLRRGGALRAPLGNDRFSFVDRRDIAAAAACALIEPGHCGRVYDLCGPQLLDMHAFVDALSAAMHMPLRYVPLSRPAFLLDRLRQKETWIEAWQAVHMHAAARTSMQGMISADLEEVLGRPPHSLEEFLAERRRV